MEQSTSKDIAILVLGAIAGLLPWLLDKVGVEMPRPVYIIFLVASVVLVWWAIANLEWLEKIPQLRGKTTSLANCILAVVAVSALLFMVYFTWREPNLGFKLPLTKKTLVLNKEFQNEEVPLDGYAYKNCKFKNVTFVWNGAKNWDLIDPEIDGAWVKTDSDIVTGTVILLKGLHMLKDETPIKEH